MLEKKMINSDASLSFAAAGIGVSYGITVGNPIPAAAFCICLWIPTGGCIDFADCSSSIAGDLSDDRMLAGIS